MNEPNEPTRSEQLSADEKALQSRIDDSLRRLFDEDRPVDFAAVHADTPPARRGVLARIGPIAAIAALLAVAAVVASGWLLTRPENTGLNIASTPLAAYERFVDAGMVPYWVCETIEEFEETFDERLGQPLTLAGFEVDGVSFAGISYSPLASGQAVAILAEAEGEPVVAFVSDKEPPADVDIGVNHIHRGMLGRLYVVEVSPLDTPSVLPLLSEVEADEADEPETTEEDAPAAQTPE
ncbi:MAG: hypothetical protein AAGB29_07780 [Planctomycetota bacterium]